MIDQGTVAYRADRTDLKAGRFRSTGDDPYPGTGKWLNNHQPAKYKSTLTLHLLTMQQARYAPSLRT